MSKPPRMANLKGMKVSLDPQSLREVPLFATMSPAHLAAILAVSELSSVGKGVTVVREDDESNRGFYVLLEGEAKVAIAGPDGREAILALLTEGDFFGEMSLLDGDPRSATVRTTSEARLLHIRREAFVNLMRECPDIAIAMLAELSMRLRQANRRIEALALMPVNGRVAAALLQLAETHGVRHKGQLILRDRPPQAEIAELACTTRETVSRVLGALQKEGILTIEGRELIILDEDKLRGPA
jgi:CRP/FNR family transcriptional regulator, cyclic AMP receptor protein